MTQEINLYDHSIYNLNIKLSPVLMLQVVLWLVACLAIFSLYDVINLMAAENKLGKIQAELAEAQEKESNFSVKYPKIILDETFIDTMKKKQEELTKKRDMLGFLLTGKESGSSGFSSYFRSMGVQWVKGMWLTRIIIESEGSVALAGKSSAAELVPDYLQALKNEESFLGKEFKVFKMLRDEEDPRYYSFYMSSVDDKNPSK